MARELHRRHGVYGARWGEIALLALVSTCFPLVARAQEDTSSRSETEEDVEAEATKADPNDAWINDPSLTGIPIVAYAPSTGVVAAGAGFFNFRARGEPESSRRSRVRIAIGASTRKQLGVELVPEIYLEDEAWVIEGDVTARYVPQDFWGVGPDRSDVEKATYDAWLLSIRTGLRRRVHGPLYFGWMVATRWMAVPDDERMALESRFEDQALRGRIGGLTSAIGPRVIWDSRDHSVTPHTGRYLELTLLANSRALGSEHDYVRLEWDARQFFEPWPSHVIALQAIGASTWGGEVPIDRMPGLGGTTRSRGFARQRYRDRHAVEVQAAYRFPLVWRFGGAVFAGVGQVAPRLAELDLGDAKPSGGAGLRFLLSESERIHARLDFGFTPEGWNFYLAIGEAF